MEQQFFEDEFEQFLRENADQHRMYPSDGVWTTIYRQLHARRRRIALGVMLLLVMSGIIWLTTSNPHIVSRQPVTGPPAEKSSATANQQAVYTKSTVTVDDIIEKLKAKSLIPPMSIEAPLTLSPLQFLKRSYMSDTYKVSDTHATHPDTQTAAVSEISMEQDLNPALISNVNIISSVALPQVTGPELVPTRQKLTVVPQTASISSLVKVSPLKPKRKVSYLMSFAPSVGYRNLFDGKNHITYGNSPLMVRHLNVNQFVDHEPAIGFELGAGIRYQASRVLAFRTGIQFNFTRYTIAAFSHSPEKTTVSLNNDYGYQRETVVTTSNVRNLVGNDPERLQNQYMQIAIPVAAELKLFGDNKLQVNLAGGIQPVYLLNTNQYLLSNDFSNYVKEPSLIRRWNVATSMEAFVSYTTRDIRWQVGPQFRYNLLSTYNKQYPIRENLMEYGVKIGVSKTIR